MNKFLKKSTLILTFFQILVLTYNSYSIEYLDTKGKDFWLTFIPNSHKTPSLSSTDSLFIFIGSDVATNGKIEYYDRSGNFYTISFNISSPNTLYKFQLQYFNYELWGYKTEYNLTQRYDSEKISKLAFHITSDAEITVYAHSQAKQTSDAFLVLPTDVLDKNYMIASFNSDGNKSYSVSGGGPMPSEFAIIASEDNTTVNIKATTEAQFNGKNQTQILNKGEVFLVQANMSSPNYNADFTGTTVDADKPISVFAGHQKAIIPAFSSNSSGSRDCLIEQLPPIKVLGKSAFITPFKQPTGVSATWNDIYRIIAVYDSTVVTVNNIKVATLNAGGYYGSNLTTAAVVNANQPFMLVQYKKTSDFDGGSNYGDPFMLVVPPKEQYMKSYTTINVQAYENSKVYMEQYITIVIPQKYINSFRLDGNSVNSSLFTQIPNSSYSYANIPVGDGVHRTQADSAFGIYIYGYGTANSFGYTGGMSFKPLDFQPPQITSIDSCYKVSGTISDSVFADSGIKEVTSIPDSLLNCDVKIGQITGNGGRFSSFSAKLNDIRFDGRFSILTLDSVNQRNLKTFNIKGFTLCLNKFEYIDTLLRFDSKQTTGSNKCFKIPIHNYGKFNQTIQDYNIKNKQNFVFSPATPYTIKAGAFDTIMVCFNSYVDSSFTDTLSFFNDCGDLKGLAEFFISTGSDRNPPKFMKNSDSCSKEFNYVINENSDWDSGIKEININQNDNCTVSIFNNNGNSAVINIKRINEKIDVIFKISILDSANNLTVISDTIRATSIEFSEIENSGTQDIFNKSFGHIVIGKIKDDFITITNNGYSIIEINDAFLSKNIQFSIPQNQFPLIIKPNESKNLIIYFHPLKSDTIAYRDTISITTDCIKYLVNLSGYADSFEETLDGKCNTNIKLTTTQIPYGKLIYLASPNPFKNEIKIHLTLTEPSNIRVDIYDSFGNIVENLAESNFARGEFEFIWKNSLINSGIYFYRIQTDNELIIKPIFKLN